MTRVVTKLSAYARQLTYRFAADGDRTSFRYRDEKLTVRRRFDTAVASLVISVSAVSIDFVTAGAVLTGGGSCEKPGTLWPPTAPIKVIMTQAYC